MACCAWSIHSSTRLICTSQLLFKVIYRFLFVDEAPSLQSELHKCQCQVKELEMRLSSYEESRARGKIGGAKDSISVGSDQENVARTARMKRSSVDYSHTFDAPERPRKFIKR